VQAETNTVKKRLEMGAKSLADFLNNSLFGHSGPVKQFHSTLGATGDNAGICVLERIRGNYTKSLFPISDAEANGSPLVKGAYKAQLHFSIGMLRIFDAAENGLNGSLPQCNFFDQNQQYIQGGNLLCPYGPLFFPILERVLPKLSPIHWEYVQNIQRPM
jgi:hypothetical protein